MYPDSEILFAPHCIPELRDLRGPKWANLIDKIGSLPDGHLDVLGFSLLIIELSSCLTCDLDSYRATLGCCTCAKRSVSGSSKVRLPRLARRGRALAEVG